MVKDVSKLGKEDKPAWKKQERRLADSAKRGREQPRSGAGDVLKGDVDADSLLIEAKYTDKKSLSIKRAWLEKITREATALGKYPALAIEFGDMPPGTPRDWVMVPKKLLEEFDDA